MGRRWHSNERGVTLIELVIAGGIAGLLSMLISRLITKPIALVEIGGEAMDNRIVFSIKARELRWRLSRSYPMRRGFIACGNDAMQQMLQETNQADVPSRVDLQDDFSIVYSEHSSLVAAGGANNVIVVPDPNQYPAGSLVLLTAINNPSYGGIYRVVANSGLAGVPPGNTVTLSEAANLRAFPDEFGCAVPAGAQNSLADFVTSPLNYTFGKNSNTFRADVIRASRYFVVQEGDGRTLMESTWPSPPRLNAAFPMPLPPGPPPDPEDDPNRMETLARVTSNYQGLSFQDITWVPTVGDPDYAPGNGNGNAGIRSNGVFSARLYLSVNSRILADTRSGGEMVRSLGQRVTYTTSSSGRVNNDAPTNPTSSELEFPTCGITAVKLDDVVELEGKRYARWHRITGMIGGNVQAGISVELTDGGSGAATCWNSELVRPATGPIGGKVYDGLVARNADGRNGRATMTFSNGLNQLYCNAPPNAGFNAVMSYFHLDLGRMVSVDCTDAVADATPESFEYVPSNETTCDRDGIIRLGTVRNVGVNPPGPGPTLYLGNDSCDWQNLGGWRDCTPHPDGRNGPRGRLQRIRQYPRDLPGGVVPHEINCT